jgi:hypothetical protein
MLGLPVSPRAKNIARYYKAFCIKRDGQFEAARERLDQLLEDELDPRLRSRALLTKAATYFDSGEVDQSLPFYVEASLVAYNCEVATLIESLRMVAVIKSAHGDHRNALADLESLLPIVFRISRHQPTPYCAVLNSLAVEFGEVGQVEQALQIVSTVAAFSPLVPEIKETIAELEGKRATKNRSVIVIHRNSEVTAQPHTTQCLKQNRAIPFWLKLHRLCSRSASYRPPPALYVSHVFITPIPIDPIRGPKKPRAPPALSFRANQNSFNVLNS